MLRLIAQVVMALAVATLECFAGTSLKTPDETSDESEPPKWEFSLEAATYLAQHSRDYVNPNFAADNDWLHLEARYNYEALKTGSVWLGYNLHFDRELKFETAPALNGPFDLKFTPMLGGVFGDVTGVAPGYALEINYNKISFSTQGEYFDDAAVHAGDFFYTWSELSYSPADWLWLGIVVDRTKVLGEKFDIRRGPLIGFKFNEHVDLTAYWLAPGSHEATFVFAVALHWERDSHLPHFSRSLRR